MGCGGGIEVVKAAGQKKRVEAKGRKGEEQWECDGWWRKSDC